MTRSRYSHTGIISREDGEIFVYDMTPIGARRTLFRHYLCDRMTWFAVKRPKPQFQGCIRDAVAYCQDVFRSRVGFDREFLLDNERLYCTELTEKSYRVSGLPLSEAIRVDDLPGYADFPVVTILCRLCSPFHPDRQIIIAGNNEIGIWSSDKLTLVLDAFKPSDPPPTAMALSFLGDGECQAGALGMVK